MCLFGGRLNCFVVCLQHQKRQQKLESRITLDSLTSPSHKECEQADDTAETKDNDNTVNESPSLSDQHPAPAGVTDQDEKNFDAVQAEEEKEEDEDSASAATSVNNRFTVLSEVQHSKEGTLCDEISNIGDDGEEDIPLVTEMGRVTLDDAFIDDPDAMERDMAGEDVQEAKEYTVISQDPELAFQTLATRTTPEKQECSVQSCLFQFTEVETLTQNNSLLCVTCTKQQQRKDKAGGTESCYFNVCVIRRSVEYIVIICALFRIQKEYLH